MSLLHPHEVPAEGWKGLRQNWSNDMLAGLSVSMVALPLSLGIAMASGAPPMAGVLSALIAGFVTTFFRGSHIAINGPGNGLIAVILLAMFSLKDGGQTFSFVLAAVVCAGFLQVGIGLLRLGKFGELFPSSVIHGILAAIGIIIMGKQLHVAMGATSEAKSTLGVLMEVPKSIMVANPAVVVIALLSLVILFAYPMIKSKLVQMIPAPMWVLVVGIPMAALFSFGEASQYSLFGMLYEVGPQYLVKLQGSLVDSFMLPNFAKIGTWTFWSVVLSITLISTVETLISAKAIDKLDPYKRTTDPNRELIGVGISSIVAGMIGGLPVVTVIARSSVNVHNHAKTRWSNFFQSGFLLLFVVLLTPIIQRVPMAALAAILIYTGYKLTAPRVFREAHKKGWEQLLFLSATLGLTLYYGLVWGLFFGTLFVLAFHHIRIGLSPVQYIREIWNPMFQIKENEQGESVVQIAGIVSFANLLQLQEKFSKIPQKQRLKLDFAKAMLVDVTVLEYINRFIENYQQAGGDCQIVGLEYHQASTSYPSALRVAGSMIIAYQPKPAVRLSRRQQELKALAQQKEWNFQVELNWNASYLKNFQFFETRPLEYKENVLSGIYPTHGVDWEISDLTFDEGALFVDEHHTTTLVLHTPSPLPEFVIERKELYDSLMEAVGHAEIDFKTFTKFSKKFVVKGRADQVAQLKELFTPELIQFLEGHNIYHLESNGEALLVFHKIRLERTQGIMMMHQFSQELLDTIFANESKQTGHIVDHDDPQDPNKKTGWPQPALTMHQSSH